jgi:hypothetical protein
LSLATKAAGASSHEALVSGGAVDAFGLLYYSMAIKNRNLIVIVVKIVWLIVVNVE